MLETNVLVLNRLFQAIQVTTVRRAFCLLYKGQVKAVNPDYSTCDWQDWVDVPPQPDEDVIVTPTLRVRIPRVILLVDFDRLPRHEVRFTRKNIFYRDRNRCQYCGHKFQTRDLNLDHVVPLSRGGKSTWDNVVCCCVTCNSRKGGHLPEDVGMRLIQTPTRPRWHPLVKISFTSSKYPVWKNFLDVAYWNTILRDE
jgi:5-methylcytosine-specific restriction endonuclease McrA